MKWHSALAYVLTFALGYGLGLWIGSHWPLTALGGFLIGIYAGIFLRERAYRRR